MRIDRRLVSHTIFRIQIEALAESDSADSLDAVYQAGQAVQIRDI